MSRMPINRNDHRAAGVGVFLDKQPSAGRRTVGRSSALSLAGVGLALLALAGCRSDDGREVKYEVLKPSEWFAFNDDEDGGDDSEPKTGVSGKTDGDIAVPPVPPAIDKPAAPPAPAASSNRSFYGVRPTASRNAAPRRVGREPSLRPIPRTYE